nr:NrfD/PsrC family molybdoenzyme membrane anchor subunit [Adlercreutzia aquisgranensis]
MLRGRRSGALGRSAWVRSLRGLLVLDTFVTVYLFLGGCAAAVVLVTCAWSLAVRAACGRRRPAPPVFGRLRVRCLLAGFVLLVLAVLCLLFDLGRPQLFWLLFARPTSSLISIGSFLLMATLLVSGFLLGASVPGAPRSSRRVLCSAEVVCCALSAGVMLYTGLYMACLEAVPLWNNPALPVLFALSSLSSGLSVVLIAASFADDRFLLAADCRRLRLAHAVSLAGEMVAVGAYLALAWGDGFARPGLEALLSPNDLGSWFVVGFLGLGVALPLGAEVFAAMARRPMEAIPLDALCIIGGLVLRFCVVIAA